jgi:hypothetical protein
MSISSYFIRVSSSRKSYFLEIVLLLYVLPTNSLWADPTQVDVSNSEFGPRILVAPDGRAGDRFGRALTTGGDVIIVGADYSPCTCAAPPAGDCPRACAGAGAAYIFIRDYVDVPVGGWVSGACSKQTFVFAYFLAIAASTAKHDAADFRQCLCSPPPPRREQTC